MSLKGDSFPFDKEQAQTLMLICFFEAFLARDRNIGTTSILGALRPNHSRIVAPGMHEDISGRDNVQSTVRNDVLIVDKLELPLMDLRPMNGTRYLRESQNVLRKVSSEKRSKSLTRAVR